jgi:hypothetical protein
MMVNSIRMMNQMMDLGMMHRFFFLILFTIFHQLKPGFAYTEEGGFRQFGLGYKQKTVIPVWIVAIVLAIFSYLFVVVCM